MSNPLAHGEIKRSNRRLSVFRETKLRYLEECLQNGYDPKVTQIHQFHDTLIFDATDYFNYMRKYQLKFDVEVNKLEPPL